MGWTCPECGFMNAEDSVVCTCGFDQSLYLSSHAAEAGAQDGLGSDPFGAGFSGRDTPAAGSSALSSTKKAIAEKPRTRRASFHPPDRITVKEVGVWKFSFAPSEGKISIWTPALEPFRLDLTLEDFEGVLESVYEVTGMQKTLRGLELKDKDVRELIEFIGDMIDTKRSKISPSFSPEDVGAVTALVNGKLSR